MIIFSCKHCSHQIKVPDNYAGKKGRCHNCQNIVEVPSKSEVTPAANVKIKFLCTSCGQKIGALKEWAGKMVKCPKCGEINEVPAEIQTQTVPKETAKNPGSLKDNQPSHVLFEQSMMEEILKMESSGTDAQEIRLQKPHPKIAPSRYAPAADDDFDAGEEKPYTYKPSRLQHNIPLTVLCSLAGALLGAIIWAIAGALTGMELGIIAIGVGALAGIGITIFTQEKTTGLGIVAALFAVFGILTGKVLVAKYVIVPEVVKIMKTGDSELLGNSENASLSPEEIKEMAGDNDAMLSVTLMYLAENKEFDKEILKQYYIGTFAEEMPPDVQQHAGKIQARVSECLSSWDTARKEQIVREMYPKVLQETTNELTDNTFFKTALGIGAFIASFSLFDLLWFPLAIWTAFKIGSGRTED